MITEEETALIERIKRAIGNAVKAEVERDPGKPADKLAPLLCTGLIEALCVVMDAIHMPLPARIEWLSSAAEKWSEMPDIAPRPKVQIPWL